MGHNRAPLAIALFVTKVCVGSYYCTHHFGTNASFRNAGFEIRYNARDTQQVSSPVVDIVWAIHTKRVVISKVREICKCYCIMHTFLYPIPMRTVVCDTCIKTRTECTYTIERGCTTDRKSREMSRGYQFMRFTNLQN